MSLGGEGRCFLPACCLLATLLQEPTSPTSCPSSGLRALRMLHGAKSFMVPPSLAAAASEGHRAGGRRGVNWSKLIQWAPGVFSEWVGSQAMNLH